jgi:integrase
MQDDGNHVSNLPKRTPWNKGKLIGPKPPLRPKHVWSIRTRLQVEGRTRDLAMFNLAVDSKLRGCDVVALRVEDVAPGGYAVDRTTVRQKKTGRPVKFELTEQTREAVDNYYGPQARSRASFSSQAVATPLATLARANTHDFFRIGSLASDLVRSCSVLIRSGGLKRP